MFDDIQNDSGKTQVIDDVPQTEDVFIDDDYLFDSTEKQETKNICDYVINDVDQNNVLFDNFPELKQTIEVKDKRMERLFEKINKK